MSVSSENSVKDIETKSALKENGTSPRSQNNGESVNNSRAVCRVCKRLYREPKILPCLHTFCADCIRQLEPFSVTTINGKALLPEHEFIRDHVPFTVLCPECDSEVDLPTSGADGLTTDHLALDEVFMETLLNENCVVCDLCSEGDAGKRCEVCCVNLCEFCSQAHRRQKRTSSHSIQSLEELKAQGRLSRPVLCALHPGQELRLFCEPCDAPVCLECAATFHREHRCSPAREVVHRHGDRLRELMAGSLRPRLATLEQSLQRVELSQEELGVRADALAAEVRAFARGYACAVEAHCRGLLRRLEELRLQRRNQLHLQGAQLRQAMTDARGAADFAERLLTCGTDTEILAAKAVTLRRLTQVVETGYNPSPATVAPDDGSSICFVPFEAAGEVDGYPVVGVIHAKAVDPSKCTIQGEGVQLGREGQRSEFTLVCRDASGEQMGKGGDAVLVSIVHKEKKDCTAEASIVDNNNGSYCVSYMPAVPGPYSVWVCVKAQHVKGSPFVLTVKRKFRRHRGMFHCCSFCSSGGAKEARCACPGTMPGGFQGCGHGHKGHPGKPHWSCCGSLVEASECLVRAVGTVPSSQLRTVEL
ncbi:tripartite motif-containing protein 45 isoform X1 [Alosa sapidissima]|uniref:tripartite motif-containing protein 45 isoform X1 n=1 Tax=Alosa sapidissima TaxID=34773 RepID=UPI001C0895C7|nr:tripartite motif-containing protein 45 isoform X1 [Alosa sapidissima]